MKEVLIIPSYNPTEELVNLIKNLIKINLKRIIVVNDGSNKESCPYFDEISIWGVHILHHERNFGKGHAIKTGIKNAPILFPDVSCIVTADSDGQHKAEDILKVVKETEKNPNHITLGTREFEKQSIPFRSQFGNRFSAVYFRFLTGVQCPDTQTGLRGIPKQFFGFATEIPGERYDYEMNFLIESARKKIPFQQCPIHVIYFENNQTSHFRPVYDSILIYKQPLRFVTSSLGSCVLDLSLFTLFIFLFPNFSLHIIAATVLARLISGVFNYTLNKYWCFQSKQKSHIDFLKYSVLFFTIMFLSGAFVTIFSTVFSDVFITIIKIIIDTGLFLLSYKIQHSWVFSEKEDPTEF